MKRQGPDKDGKQENKAAASSSSQDAHPPVPSFPASNSKLPPSSQPVAQPSSSNTQNPQKVAIPRLRPNEDRITVKRSSNIDKNRVTHACEPCRNRKTKCSGERPICQHCQDFKITCVYEDGKRDRAKRQLETLAGKVEEYEQLLEDLSLRVEGDDQYMIRRALDQERYCGDDDQSEGVKPQGRGRAYREKAGEEKVSARVGSTESLDRISEDFNKDATTRATGFYGKNSELTWMQRLKRQASSGSSDSDEYEPGLVNEETSSTPPTHHFGSGLTPISTSSYHCDDLNVFVAEQVDPFGLPMQNTANLLLQSYLDNVHPSFPIIDSNTFWQEYNTFITTPIQMKRQDSWLAILNMIFAIGARYSHLIQAEWQGDARDHLIFFTRARMLGFNAETMLGHAGIQKIQITGLMAFYLMATNQVNRSWSVSGIAVRHACTLGLNLRNESKDISDTSKELRYRVWWAVCSIERVLAVMTGRPTFFTETDCTAPLPYPTEEESVGSTMHSSQGIQTSRLWSDQDLMQFGIANSSPSSDTQSSKKGKTPSDILASPVSQRSIQSHRQPFPSCDFLALRYHITLSTFTNEVLISLYRASAISETWAHVQESISSLNQKLENWRLELPPVFDFTKNQRDQRFLRNRKSLGFFYYSTLIIINRPCLCRIDRKITDESDTAKIFNRETAMRCVHAARDMLELLPEHSNSTGLFKIAPWWCLVHQLMQSATILMLELSFRADHMPNEVEEVFESAKKALAWLSNMSEVDEAARRAAVLCNQMLRQVAPKVGRNPSDASHFEPDGVNPIQSVADMQGMQHPESAPSGLSQYQAQYGYTSSAPFQPPAFTTYDQFLSYGHLPTTSSQAPFDDLFPTASDMEGMTFQDHEPMDYFQGHDQRWYPGSGP